MADPRLKQIRIKTGVVNRIAKEKQSYEKETETEKNRLLKLKDNGEFHGQILFDIWNASFGSILPFFVLSGK